MSIKLKSLIIILGPTASGKTKTAVKLAKKFDGEIISADSRQVYKEMDIGTGKTTKKEMESIPHYLIDIVKPNREFNVALFKKMAVKKIKDVQKRGKIPFLVGGTGLYIAAIAENIEFPKIKADLKLRKELEKKDTEKLFKIYEKLDAKGAKHIDKKNKRRLIRAIEVCKATGKPFWKKREKEKPLFNILEIGIKLPQKKLEKRISKRVEEMIKTELEKEVRKLDKKYGLDSPALRTIGYQEWPEYFKKEKTIDEVKKNIILHTVQFSKRQATWFRRDPKINWVKNYSQAKKLVNNFLKFKKIHKT